MSRVAYAFTSLVFLLVQIGANPQDKVDGRVLTRGVSARLEVSPTRILEGDRVSIKIIGLRPGDQATVHVQSTAFDDEGKLQAFYAEATLMADANGSIDLATAGPVTGYYQGADLRGLF